MFTKRDALRNIPVPKGIPFETRAVKGGVQRFVITATSKPNEPLLTREKCLHQRTDGVAIYISYET